METGSELVGMTQASVGRQVGDGWVLIPFGGEDRVQVGCERQERKDGRRVYKT